jgi:hypothetical protein
MLDGRDPIGNNVNLEASFNALPDENRSDLHSARHSMVSEAFTIQMTEYSSSQPPKESITYKELFDHIEKIEREYEEISANELIKSGTYGNIIMSPS